MTAARRRDQGWQSHRIENRITSHIFLGKISHLIIDQNNQKNSIRYRIAEFDNKICNFFDYFDFLSLILLVSFVWS